MADPGRDLPHAERALIVAQNDSAVPATSTSPPLGLAVGRAATGSHRTVEPLRSSSRRIAIRAPAALSRSMAHPWHSRCRPAVFGVVRAMPLSSRCGSSAFVGIRLTFNRTVEARVSIPRTSTPKGPGRAADPQAVDSGSSVLARVSARVRSCSGGSADVRGASGRGAEWFRHQWCWPGRGPV